MESTTGYIGRHRGSMPALVRITDSLIWTEGIYRHRSGSTGAFWYSTTGNNWFGSLAAAVRAGRS
jgi:hypothetical protein